VRHGNSGKLYPTSGGGHVHELPLVRAAPGEALGDRLPLGDYLLDGPTEVGKAGEHHGAGLLEGLGSGAHEHAAEVQRAIGGDYLVDDIQVTEVDHSS
jgi:hypothetical protein